MNTATPEIPVKKISTHQSDCYIQPRHPIAQFDEDKPVDISSIESFLDFYDQLEKKNLALFAIAHCARRMLPYGIWTCDDGREVVFNREYQPIFQRLHGVVSYADRDEIVKGIQSAEMLYNDFSSPVSYMTKHLGRSGDTSARQSRVQRKCLLRVLQVMKDFTPPESFSTNRQWSLIKK